MGFGRTLVRGLGAGMVGYGKTLTQQAERAQAQQDADAVMRRQMALEELRTQSQMRTTDFAGTVAERTYRGNKATDVGAEIELLGPRTDAKIRADAAGSAADLAAKKEILRLQHDYSLSEIDAKSAADIKHDLELAGAKVGEMQVSRDGRLVVFNEKGDIIRTTKPGTFTPPRTGTGDGDQPITVPPRSGEAAAPIAPAGTRPLVGPAATEQDFTQFNTALAQAATHPSNRGKSADQIRRETIALARAAGLPTPDR